jgi:TPR repeat protein
MKFILIFAILFLFINSNQSMADIKDCDVIKDKIKKKNCLIENKAEKLKKKIKEKSSDVKEKITSEMKPTLEKHKKFQKKAPKTLFDLFKKNKNK